MNAYLFLNPLASSVGLTFQNADAIMNFDMKRHAGKELSRPLSENRRKVRGGERAGSSSPLRRMYASMLRAGNGAAGIPR